MQSRNSLIGNYTERWVTELLQTILSLKGLFAIQGAVCREISLSKQSPGDVVVAKVNSINLKPNDILVIFEVKMSIVWNWEYLPETNKIHCLGDYKSHQGNPGMLRSDSMLKAIGKGINIRVSDYKSSKIPIVVIGNTPITSSYYSKADHLKMAGIIQGFWSVNPNPLDNNGENIKTTIKKGFIRFDTLNELAKSLGNLLSQELNFFSSMKSKKALGSIIESSNRKSTYEEKAEEFLKLIGE